MMAAISLQPGRVVILHFSGAKLSGWPGIKHALRACCSSTTAVLSTDDEVKAVTEILLDRDVHVAALKAARDRPCVLVQAGNMELLHYARVFSFPPPKAFSERGVDAAWGRLLRSRGYSADLPMTSRWVADAAASAPRAKADGKLGWTGANWSHASS